MQHLLEELKIVKQEITVIPADYKGKYDSEAAELVFRGLLDKSAALLTRIQPVLEQLIRFHQDACDTVEKANRELAVAREKSDDYVRVNENRLRKRQEKIIDRELAASYRLAGAE